MQSLPRTYDFKALEQHALEKWKAHALVEKTTSYNPQKPIFSFLEGPPTANAPPALHHVEVRVFKDLVNRYQFMRGKTVPRKGGWDTHGLPVEVQVEKKLGLKNKQEIEQYGTEKFVEACRSDVNTFIHEWDGLTERMGYWVDLEHPYVTMSNDYIESVWWSLKQLFERNYLYEGHKTVPFCPRCQTSLSSHEVAQGYKTVKDTSAVVEFPSTKNKGRIFLAWTTTPWTLPGNMALAVHPDVDYALVEKDGNEYVVAHTLVGKHFPAHPSIKKVLKGKELAGESYLPPFDTYTQPEAKLNGKKFIVVPAEFVTVEDGTGIVHIAPGFGEDDYATGKQHGLAFVQHVNEDGTFKPEMGAWAGKDHQKKQGELLKDLEARGKLFKTEKFEHEYPHCWRCSTPLMYYAMKSWFINVSQHRNLLMKLNREIQWTPAHVQDGRFGEWIANAKDWGLSRKRYWGTPLPIWRCTNPKCAHLAAIGSVAELREKGKNTPNGTFDLHKPTLDPIVLWCTQCKGEMKRESDVIDCWYDSGSAPFAQLHYPFENKELFEKFFPYDYIAEAQDQTRGWFYTMLVVNALLFGKSPYKTVICAGLMLDEKGEKMSKSKGNIIQPSIAFDAQGVDAVRLWFCTTPPGAEKKFGTTALTESVRPFLNVLWNSLLFSQPYLAKGQLVNQPALETEDKWILSRLAGCRDDVTRGLDQYAFNECTQALFQFVNEDFSRTYIKLVRERAKQGDETVAFVFFRVWDTLARLLAPFAPYVSEALFEAVNGELENTGLSVHASQWPEAAPRNESLEKHMRHAQAVITVGLAMREKEKINVRWPLRRVNVQTANTEVKEAVAALEGMISNQLNVKNVGVNEKIFAHAQPFANDSETMVSLDMSMDDSLLAEGFAREVMRKIQELRKKAETNPSQLIRAEIRTDENTKKWLTVHLDDIKQKVRARELVFVPVLGKKPLASADETIRESRVSVAIFSVETAGKKND